MTMTSQQDTVQDILNSELTLVQQAPDKYGEYFAFAMSAHSVLQDFLLSTDATRFIFVLFLSQMRKHVLLSILSTVRLHRVQAHMCVRQILESGANAAYAIANPSLSDFGQKGSKGVMEIPPRLKDKRYKWIKENHPVMSRSIEGIKKILNDSTIHPNIVSGTLNFKLNPKGNVFDTPFFDTEDEDHQKGDLWMIGDAVMGLMDLFYGVNREVAFLEFSPHFLERMKALREQDNRLRQEMITSKRFQDAMQLRTG